jgi:thymidylate synthase (FAD)
MYKTIQECRLDLVAHSIHAKPYWAEDGEWDSQEINNQDFFACSAARVSFGNEDKTGNDVEKDKKLMKYLADHKHLTPFEYQHATFLIECPLFIRSQIHRHRTFSFNEISRRYTDENLEFWIPDKWRKQSASNKQASSSEEALPRDWSPRSTKEAIKDYDYLLEQGVCREQARAVLPQSLLTKFYMAGSLRNWAHFLELRLDDHAQYEIRVVAERIRDELKKLWPNSMEALGI